MHDTKSILVTGSPRSGSTWVGRMLSVSALETYYLGEIFSPEDGRLNREQLPHWYMYLREGEGDRNGLKESVRRILAYDFSWPNTAGERRILPSRLHLIRQTRRWFGLPRPVVKDPIAVFSSAWLAHTFDLHVVCLIRHPAAFAVSMKKAGWSVGFRGFLSQPSLMEDWLYPFAAQMLKPQGSFVEQAALFWNCIYYVLLSLVERNPTWKLSRLEDISEHPSESFREIYQLVGLNYSSQVEARIRATSSEKNPAESDSGNRHSIARNSRAAQHAWRTQLTSEETRAIRHITEPVAHNYYYSEEDWSTPEP